MLYEFAMAAVLAGVLWLVRKHPFKAGWLISLYAVFAGLERLLIEQIRVNNKGEILGITMTQAELISVIMMIIGGVILYRTWKRREADEAAPAATQPAGA